MVQFSELFKDQKIVAILSNHENQMPAAPERGQQNKIWFLGKFLT